MNRSTPGLPVNHQLPEFTQTHVHQVNDAIQPSHPLSSPSPPAPNPSQHQSLFHFVVFLYFFALITEEGFLISLFFGTLHSNGYIFPFLLCLLLLFYSQLFVRTPQTTILPFLFWGMVLITASCTMSQTSIHSSSGTLSIRSNPLNLFITSTVWDFDLGHTWMV